MLYLPYLPYAFGMSLNEGLAGLLWVIFEALVLHALGWAATKRQRLAGLHLIGSSSYDIL